VLGVGLGQYVRAKDDYLSDRTTELQLEGVRDQLLHNLPLSILVESGLIGFGLYLWMFFAWTRDAWRLWRNSRLPDWARSQGLIMMGLMAAYIPNALFQPLGHMNVVQMTFFFVAGMNAALVGMLQTTEAAPQTRPLQQQPRPILLPAGDVR
jgi:O-antigen ligase